MASSTDSIGTGRSALDARDGSAERFDELVSQARDRAEGKHEETSPVGTDNPDAIGEGAKRSIVLPKGKQPENETASPSREDLWNDILGDDNGYDRNDLLRPMDMGQKLLDKWYDWGLNEGKNFSNPPDDLPDDAKEVLKYFASSRNLMTAIDNGSNTDKRADGVVTRDEVVAFYDRSRENLKKASDAYKDFLPKSKDDAARGVARQAAILMANQHLVAASGNQMYNNAENQRQNNGGIHPSNLNGVYDDNALSDELRNAAGFWKEAGTRNVLDAAGEHSATADRDLVIGSDNIDYWLRNAAPEDATQTLDFLEKATLGRLTNAASSLSDEDKKHFFDDLGNRSAEQKAGVMIELTQALAKLEAGKEAGLWGSVRDKPLDDDFEAVKSDLSDKIKRLTEDKDVQAAIVQTRNGAVRSIASEAPEIIRGLKEYAKNQFQDGAYLDGLDLSTLREGKNINAEELGEVTKKLAEFGQKAFAFHKATSPKDAPDLAAALETKGLLDDVKSIYENKIKNGDMLKDMLDAGKSADEAVREYGAAIASFSTMLSGSGTELSSSAQLVNHLGDVLADRATLDDLKPFMGKDGNIDEETLVGFINEASKNDPDLFVDDKSQPIDPKKIAGLVTTLAGAMHSGASARDAMAKLGWIDEATGKLPSGVNTLLNNGSISAVRAALSGGALMTRIITGDTESSAGKAAVAASALQLFGAMSKARYQPMPVDDLFKPVLKHAGPILAAAGGSIGGVLGIIGGTQQLNAGETAQGALTLTDGIVGSGLALLDSAVALTGVFGLPGAATLSTLANVLGPIGVVAGAGMTIAQIILESVAHSSKVGDFVGDVSDVLTPYGIGLEKGVNALDAYRPPQISARV